MHAVYSRAEEVCIYFGENADWTGHKGKSEHVYIIMLDDTEFWGCRRLGVAQELQKLVDDSDGSECATNIIGQFLDDCASLVYRIHPAKFVQAAEDSLRGDPADGSSSLYFWWKRLWTVQELLLAKRPVVYYGRCVMRWNTIYRIWSFGEPRFRREVPEPWLPKTYQTKPRGNRRNALPWRWNIPQRGVSETSFILTAYAINANVACTLCSWRLSTKPSLSPRTESLLF
jgi:hypothetical protein